MASSADKAVALKDSYVKGIISDLGGAGEEQTLNGTGRHTPLPELAGKLGMEQGQQASIMHDIDRGTTNYVNDGNPYHMIEGKGVSTQTYSPASAMPIPGGIKYDGYSTRMTPRLQQQLTDKLDEDVRNGFYVRGARGYQIDQDINSLKEVDSVFFMDPRRRD